MIVAIFQGDRREKSVIGFFVAVVLEEFMGFTFMATLNLITNHVIILN